MTIREAAIHTCKEQIRYAANYAGLNWSDDDLICVHDDNVGDVVFLRRFNPHEAIGDDGNAVMRDGKPVMEWINTLWAEWKMDVLHVGCIAPWLTRIVAPDGTIVQHADRCDIQNAIAAVSVGMALRQATNSVSRALWDVSLDDDSTCARLHSMAQEASMVRPTDCVCQCNAGVHNVSRGQDGCGTERCAGGT